MQTNSAGQNDISMNVSTIAVPVQHFAETIINKQITVDRIAGIFFEEDEGRVYAAYLSGALDIASKGNVVIPGKTLPMLVSWQKIMGADLFEVDAVEEVVASKWLVLIHELEKILDKNGDCITSFFGAGYGSKSTEQYVYACGKLFWLTGANGPSITSIRYDRINNILYGIGLDRRKLGTEIVGFRASMLLEKPERIIDIGNWYAFLDNVSPAMLSLSRIGHSDGSVHFVVNYPNSYHRKLTIRFAETKYTATWHKGYASPFITIGPIWSLDEIWVGYRFRETEIQIGFGDAADSIAPGEPDEIPLYPVFE